MDHGQENGRRSTPNASSQATGTPSSRQARDTAPSVLGQAGPLPLYFQLGYNYTAERPNAASPLRTTSEG